MKMRAFGIVFGLMMIVPIQTVIGESQINKSIILEDVVKHNFEKEVINMINQVNKPLISRYLEELVNFGPRFTGSKNCRKAAKYLYDEFDKLGLDVKIDSWRYIQYQCQNVVATLKGHDPSSDKVILLSAHYDTIGNSPGANDDGTGVAAILAIANICSKYSFNHTIRFVAVSGEEVGTFGSFADAKKAYNKNENIVAILNIDTIGNTSSSNNGKTIYMFTNDRARWIPSFSDQIAKKYEEFIDLTVQPAPNFRIDHQPYIDYGYDGATYVQPNVDQYKWIHTPEDTINKINYTYFIKVTKLILATTVELANRPIDVQVKIVTPLEGYLYLFDYPILKLPCFNLVFSGFRAMTYIIGNTVTRLDILTEEEIECVIFGIDGDIWHVARQPPYEWRIKMEMISFFPLKGKHTLNVNVMTTSGNTAYDEMDIFVFTLF
jgi:hypothetical protein